MNSRRIGARPPVRLLKGKKSSLVKGATSVIFAMLVAACSQANLNDPSAGNRLVVMTDSGYYATVNLTQHRVMTSTILSVGGTTDLATSDSSSTAYVAAYFENQLVEIDSVTGQTIRVIGAGERPAFLALSPGGRAVVIDAGIAKDPTVPSNSRIRIIDLRSGKTVREIELGFSAIAPPILSADGQSIIVASPFDGIVAEVGLLQGNVLKRVRVAGQPSFMALAPWDSSLLYVSTVTGRKVVAIDLATGRIRSRIDVSGEPGPIRVGLDHTLYVATVSGKILAIDLASVSRSAWSLLMASTASSSSPSVPTRMVLDTNRKRLIVATSDESLVFVNSVNGHVESTLGVPVRGDIDALSLVGS